MNKQQFLDLHLPYIESTKRTLSSAKIQDFALRDKELIPQSERIRGDIDSINEDLAHQFEQVQKDVSNLERILEALKSGETLREEDRETFYAFALTLPHLGEVAGSEHHMMQIDQPQLYVQSFTTGRLEPILVQGELIFGKDRKPIREHRTAFYIDSSKGHGITSLMRLQRETEGPNIHVEIIADPFDVYLFGKSFSR